MNNLNQQKEELTKEIDEIAEEYQSVLEKYQGTVDELAQIGEIPETFYKRQQDAYGHQTTVTALTESLQESLDKTNPYSYQIKTLQDSGLQKIDYDNVNELTALKDHQDFLLKLLTDKGSFIRKKIIDQNLSLLNHRLSHYLEKLGLPHEVKFRNDLSVEISQLGRDFDFDNLSRGERNRLILSLSWAFRDVFESMNRPINLMFIDELVDSGLDSSGVESALEVLKKMSRERSKNIYLISHREELITRVSQIMKVVKDNGFTSFESNVDDTDM